MRVAIVTFDGFNELDSFVALGLLNRLKPQGWNAEIASPDSHVTSMNGVTMLSQRPLAFANEADGVLFGSGIYTRAIGQNSTVLDGLRLDPLRQLIGAQCSGTLLLARLGLLGDMPACTDLSSKPWVVEAGVLVVDEPFRARGPIATAGGCMASVYLATWMIARGAGVDAAEAALHDVAPVGEKDSFVAHALEVVTPFLDTAAP
jgi:transcriptional regulator GlxA family with amidase domain